MTKKKIWFITGASRGMGVELAKAALAAGHTVVASGRDSAAVSRALGQSNDLLVDAHARRMSRDVNMSNKPALNDALKNRLSRSREVTITMTGRKSGRTISIPVWFVLDDKQLYLLPVHGSNTQWYRNALQNPLIRIHAGGVEAGLKAVLITDSKHVSSVVEKFRAKYGKAA